MFTSWQSPVSWASFKIRSVAASSCEAEYMSASQAVRHSKWLRYLFSDLGYGDLQPTQLGSLCSDDYRKRSLSADRDPKERGKHWPQPLMLAIDNKGAIALSNNPVLHRRSKHIHINYHIVRQEVARKNVRLNYISTVDNLADLMTKSLPRATHYRLVKHLLHSVTDGRLYRLGQSQEVTWRETPPMREKLYVKRVRGLLDRDMLLEGPVKTYRGDIDHAGRPAGPGVPTAPADALSATLDGAFGAVAQQCRLALLSMLGDALRDEIGQCMQAMLLRDAIVDSGASYTYVPSGVELQNERAGVGAVSVANGRVEPVSAIGDIGALRNVRKVDSFTRTLVSVRDLVEQFGTVSFTRRGVFIRRRGKNSLIGEPLPNRLYSFNLDALNECIRGEGRMTTAA